MPRPISVGLVLVLSSAGCTPSARLTLPMTDVEQRALDRRASEACCRQRPACDLPPRSFTTDGCSMWPNGSWVACCVEHDIGYWCGGPKEARKRADDAFRACMRAKSGACHAALTYVAVRVAGAAWLPFPWRWGYGWDWLADPQ